MPNSNIKRLKIAMQRNVMHPYLSFEALLSFQIDVTELFTVLKKPPEPTRMWTIKQCYDDNNNSSNNSEELAM